RDRPHRAVRGPATQDPQRRSAGRPEPPLTNAGWLPRCPRRGTLPSRVPVRQALRFGRCRPAPAPRRQAEPPPPRERPTIVNPLFLGHDDDSAALSGGQSFVMKGDTRVLGIFAIELVDQAGRLGVPNLQRAIGNLVAGKAVACKPLRPDWFEYIGRLVP